MKNSDKARVSGEVIARKLGEEMVMLDLQSGTYFGLDAAGCRIWELLAEGMTLAQVCDAMTLEFDVSRDDIERDVARLAEELAARGLIVLA